MVGFDVPNDHRVKLKEREKQDKYFYLGREKNEQEIEFVRLVKPPRDW